MRLFLSKLFIALFLFAPARGPATASCWGALYFGSAHEDPFRHDLVNYFRHAAESHILHMPPKPALARAVKYEYIVGNEFDYTKAPIDREPSDLVAGVGSTAVWTTAVRANAKQMILIDRTEGPAILNEYFWKPLAVMSNSPNEFVANMFGLTLPESLKSAKIHEAWGAMVRMIEQSQSDRGVRSELAQLNKQFQRTLEVYVRGLPTDQQFGLQQVFIPVTESAVTGQSIYSPIFGGPINHGRVVYNAFAHAFIQPSVDAVRAPPEAVLRDPLLNPFASQLAYERWRNLMVGAKYIIARADSIEVLDQLGKLAREKNYRAVTLAHSNTADSNAAGVLGGDPDEEIRNSNEKYLNWGAAIGLKNFTALHTRGLGTEHDFDAYRINFETQPTRIVHSTTAKVIPLVGRIALADIPAANGERIRKEIIARAKDVYDEGVKSGTDTLFPIADSLYEQIQLDDRNTKFSQVMFDGDAHVIGFALARRDPLNGRVHLEKIAVTAPNRRRGIMSTMLNAIAAKAEAAGIADIDLLVVKYNTSARAAYEQLGFVDETPAEARNDPRFNAFRLQVSSAILLQRTANP